MKKLVTFILLLIGILSFGSLDIYANDISYTFDEDKYQIIPTDLSGTVWTLKTFDYNETDTIEFLEVAPLLMNDTFDGFDLLFGINFISNNENMTYIRFFTTDEGDGMTISIIYYYDFISGSKTVLGEWFMYYDMSDIDYVSADPDYFSISIIDGDDSKNRILIALMTTLFTWQNPPTPTEPEIPEEPTDEPFLTTNEITKLMIALVIYIVALFVGMLAKSKLLIAMTGLLWLIPLTTIDNFIIRIFSIIMLIISLMILLKERDDYYD